MCEDKEEMNTQRHNLLIACFYETRDLQNCELDPDSEGWEVEEFQLQLKHGPLYQSSIWFYYAPPNIKKRYLREIHRMKTAGLLVIHKMHGDRLSHIKLTPEGERLAKKRIALKDKERSQV